MIFLFKGARILRFHLNLPGCVMGTSPHLDPATVASTCTHYLTPVTKVIFVAVVVVVVVVVVVGSSLLHCFWGFLHLDSWKRRGWVSPPVSIYIKCTSYPTYQLLYMFQFTNQILTALCENMIPVRAPSKLSENEYHFQVDQGWRKFFKAQQMLLQETHHPWKSPLIKTYTEPPSALG